MGKTSQGNTYKRVCRTDEAGFSLVEMVVAVGLFAIVMVVAIGALLALVDASRKARTLESVMNNLNISLDSMVRSIRMGSNYTCNTASIPGTYSATGADCAEGETLLSFTPYGKDELEQDERAVFYFQDGRLYRSLTGSVENAIPITAPEVVIEDLKFYVIGTKPGDTTQPKVVVIIKGSAGELNSKFRTTFYVQATSVQRVLDI